MFCLSVLFDYICNFLSILINIDFWVASSHHLSQFSILLYISARDLWPLATLILPSLFLLYILFSVIWIVLKQYQLYTYQNFYTFSCCLFWFNSSHFIYNHISYFSCLHCLIIIIDSFITYLSQLLDSQYMILLILTSLNSFCCTTISSQYSIFKIYFNYFSITTFISYPILSPFTDFYIIDYSIFFSQFAHLIFPSLYIFLPASKYTLIFYHFLLLFTLIFSSHCTFMSIYFSIISV